MQSSQRFVLAFLATLTVLIAGTIAAVLAVNPYNIYDVFPDTSFTQNKPRQRFHDRLFKAHLARQLKPDLVMLGTSRTQVGLDPLSPELKSIAQRPANLALSGGSMYEARRYLQHAHAVGSVKWALVGVDFTARGQSDNMEFAEERLAVSAQGQPQPASWWFDTGATLLSLDAVRDAWNTLRRQNEPSYFFAHGRRNPTFMIENTHAKGGIRGAFLEVEQEHISAFGKSDFQEQQAGALHELARLLEFAAQHTIKVRLFISPSHARSWLVADAMQLGSNVVAWKRSLVDLAQNSPADVALWDFSGADPRFTGEPVPSAGDKYTSMRWYFEGSHYKRDLGEHVLRCMLHNNCVLGRKLTPTTFDANMRDINRELATYKALHPSEMLELWALANDARRQSLAVQVELHKPGP